MNLRRAASLPALALLCSGLTGCPRQIRVEERLPPPPPLDRGRLDEGKLTNVRRPSRLTADPAQEYDPAPSPDGTMLAFVSHRRGNADIFLRFLPGSGRVGEYPIVEHYASDSDPAWSPNGRQIAFVSRRDDPKGDLYIYNLKSGDSIPDAIRDAILKKFGDALRDPETALGNPERDQLARISAFLEKRDPVIRLSDAERENRSPVWAPDGQTLFYSARRPGEPENVWAVDLRDFDAKQVTTGGGFDPAVSPDGKYLAYASRPGSIRVRRIADGATASVTGWTSRPGLDGFPAWSPDGSTLFFSRWDTDTNRDGKLDVNDRPAIHAARFDAASLEEPDAASPAVSWPVTPAGGYDLFPAVAGGRLFYSSEGFDGRSASAGGGNSDIWAIPETGIFPQMLDAAEELLLADALAPEPTLRLLLLDQIVSGRASTDPAAQDAALAAARLRAERGAFDDAERDVKAMLAGTALDGRRRARAHVLAGRIDALRAERSGPGGTLDKPALRRAADRLEREAGGFPASRTAARAEGLFEAGNARAAAGDALAATELWQRAVREGSSLGEPEGPNVAIGAGDELEWPRAEAWLSSAMAYGGLGQSDRSVATFLAALEAYPDLHVPAERRAAVERNRRALVERIERAIAEDTGRAAHAGGIAADALPDVAVPETYGERAAEGMAAAAILGARDGLSAIAALRDLAHKHRDVPVLPSLARNEIGDLYVRLGDLESAIQEFAAVAASGADARQAQRARLSGARTLLIAGRYADAVAALGPPPASSSSGGSGRGFGQGVRGRSPDKPDGRTNPPGSPKGGPIPRGARRVNGPGDAGAQLARRAHRAYVRTLLAKADEEFRAADFALARKSYRAVLGVDAREVRAHRGLIASYAALGEADRAALIYEEEARKTPADPLIRYGVGLAYTYRTPESKWLPRAQEELEQAVFLDDAAVFPHQTLGFVHEKREELFGEKGGFEKAADQYLLALSLNDVRDDYRNEADLLLNVGNAFFQLRHFRRAYDYFVRRERAGVPFDVTGRELVFLERIAKSAFEDSRPGEAVGRYDAALAFLEGPGAGELPEKTATQHRARLLDERAYALAQSGRTAEASVAFLDAARANSIAGHGANSARALRNAAINLFETGTGNGGKEEEGVRGSSPGQPEGREGVRGSSPGQPEGREGVRGSSPGEPEGRVDRNALIEALGHLEESLKQVETHGVVEQQDRRKKKALFQYRMRVSLTDDASDAVEGFSAAGEKELIFSFIGRIYESLGDPGRARERFEKKRAMLPANVKPEQQAGVDFKRALLDNQIGVLAYATGDVESAWTAFRNSYHRSLSLGNVHGGMTNAVNLSLIAIERADAAWIEEALEIDRDALSLLKSTGTPDPERYMGPLHAAVGSLLLRKAMVAGADESAAEPRALLERWSSQARILALAEASFKSALDAVDGAPRQIPEFNRIRVAALQGLGTLAALDGRVEEASRRHTAAGKAASERGMDGLAAAAACEVAFLSGRTDELESALTELESVPGPVLARELDQYGIEPWYRSLAAGALASGEATAAMQFMERMRALQLVALAGGEFPPDRSRDGAAFSDALAADTSELLRAHRALGSYFGPAEGDEWRTLRKAMDGARSTWAQSVESWGSRDLVAWTIAFPAPLDPFDLTLALPAETVFVYFVAQPDMLWAISCADGVCEASKAGPSPAANPEGARAAAAKALSEAVASLPPGARVQVVPDVGLYDPSWVPDALRAGRVVAFHRSAAAVVAADSRRAPYDERQVVASTAGAERFLTAAHRADVLRLDVPGEVPAGRPLDVRWELPRPAGPAPARTVGARAILRAGVRPASIVADVTPDADPETLLALADLWVRAGAGTVVFFPPAETVVADKVALGEVPLAGSPALLTCGHPGMNADELRFYADEEFGGALSRGNRALTERRWEDAMADYDRTLYLMDTLKVKGPEADILGALTMAAFQARQWPRGERYAAERVRTLEAAGETGIPHAEALVLRGVLEQRAERFDAAVATLERAGARFEELGHPKGLAESLSNLGLAFEKKNAAAEAVAAFRKALMVEEELGSAAGAGDLHRKIGRVYYSHLEDYAKAEESFARARDAFREAGDPRGEDEATLEIGLVAERRGALEVSARTYSAVYERAKARKDPALTGKAALFLANTAWLSGRYQDAFVGVREVRRLSAEAKDPRLAFLARSTEGLIHWTLNDLPRATSLQEEALGLARELNSPLDEASTFNNLGIIWRSAGEYDKAIANFEKALEIDRAQSSRWGQAYDLRNLGLTWLRSTTPGRAGEPLEEAVRLSSSIGDKVNGTKSVLALADYHLLRRDRGKARALYTRALDASKEAHLPEVTWRAHRGLAAVAEAENDHAGARRELEAALNVVEALRGAIRVEELKNGFIANKLDLYDDAIRLALDHPAPDADPAEVSWSYSERSRARSFIDLLANRNVDLASPRESAWIDEQRALKDQVFAAEDALAKAPDAEKPERARILSDLRERYRDLLIEIRAGNPKLSAFVTVDPPDLSRVREVLGTDTALVEYQVGARETIVWTLTDSELVVRRIPVERMALASRVKEYLGKMEAVRPVDAEANALWKLLVEPALGPETKGKRYLGIVPHGVLHYVPFAALKSGGAGTGEYLVDRYSLFYAPSAAVLSLTLAQKDLFAGQTRTAARVLAIGNPDLGDPSFALPFAELEVGDLRLDFPRIDVLTQERATARWVAENVGEYRVIHFACHGEFDPVNPLFSSLRLAKEPGQQASNGALEAHEIFGLPLKAELVTLSACRTGLGKIEAGDELIGLNRAFLYAGTRSIMSTLWRVHDGSTAILVKHFYRGYARESKADALRGAMRQVREYYPHPAYWAAFALTGEYR